MPRDKKRATSKDWRSDLPGASLRPLWFYQLDIATSTRYIRRKFRSQTSDNIRRWKSEMGRVREKKRRRMKIKKRKSPKKEDPGAKR